MTRLESVFHCALTGRRWRSVSDVGRSLLEGKLLSECTPKLNLTFLQWGWILSQGQAAVRVHPQAQLALFAMWVNPWKSRANFSQNVTPCSTCSFCEAGRFLRKREQTAVKMYPKLNLPSSRCGLIEKQRRRRQSELSFISASGLPLCRATIWTKTMEIQMLSYRSAAAVTIWVNENSCAPNYYVMENT